MEAQLSDALSKEPTGRHQLRRGLTITFVLALLTGGTTGCTPAPELPILHAVTAFTLEAAAEPGQTHSAFSTNDLKGRYHLVDFVFTECPLACPTMTLEMQRLYDEFPSENLAFVSISVDPENDSLDVLSAYRENLEVDSKRWHFLRGDIEVVRSLSEKGFLLAASDLPYGHSLRFVLVDPEAKIRGFYQSDDPEHLSQLRRDLKQVL